MNEHPKMSSSIETETSWKQNSENTLNFFSLTYISYKFIIKKSSSRLTTKTNCWRTSPESCWGRWGRRWSAMIWRQRCRRFEPVWIGQPNTARHLTRSSLFRKSFFELINWIFNEFFVCYEFNDFNQNKKSTKRRCQLYCPGYPQTSNFSE